MHVVKVSSEKLSKEQSVQLRKLLELVGWNKRQIDGQIDAIEKFLKDRNCIVLFALEDSEIIGYVSAQFYSWNRLGQIHGLVVHPEHRNKGFASKLVKEVEMFMQANGARGVYVDTPVNNISGSTFYKNNSFKQAYVMPEYYDEGMDGVTFLKLFHRKTL